MFNAALRVALALGLLIDAGGGVIALFAQPLLQPVFDIPVKDPAITTLFAGELLVVACVYALLLRDLTRWRPLLWLCALDQLFAVVLPALEVVRGELPGTFKTIGPMPFQLLLAAVYVAGLKRSATPSMQ